MFLRLIPNKGFGDFIQGLSCIKSLFQYFMPKLHFRIWMKLIRLFVSTQQIFEKKLQLVSAHVGEMA